MRGDIDAAAKGRVIGEELVRQGASQAVKDADVRPAARAGAGDDAARDDPAAPRKVVGPSDAHAAGEPRVVGEEAAQQRAGEPVEDLDVRPAAGPRAGDN